MRGFFIATRSMSGLLWGVLVASLIAGISGAGFSEEVLEEKPARPVLRDAVAEDADPVDAQFKEFLRRYARGEIFLIHKSCSLSAEEIDQLKEAGEKEVQRMLKQRKGGGAAADQLRNAGILLMPNGGRVNNRGTWDSRASVREAISKKAKTLLSEERYASYEREVKSREESRKRASIGSIVARIDRDLVLNDEQREKLTEVLTTSLKSTEYSTPEEYAYMQQATVPPIPSKLIEPLLTESQQRAWRRLPKRQHRMNVEELLLNNGQNLMGMTEEDLESLKKPAGDAPAGKPEPKEGKS